MHTFGGIILAIIVSMIMQFLLGIVGTFIAGPMYESVGFLLPMIMLAAFTGFAHFGGVTFAANVASQSNPKIIGWVLVGMIAVLVIYHFSTARNVNGIEVFVTLVTNVAAMLGSLAAGYTARLST